MTHRARIARWGTAVAAVIAVLLVTAPRAHASEVVLVLSGDAEYVGTVRDAARTALEALEIEVVDPSVPLDANAVVACAATSVQCSEVVEGAGAELILTLEIIATQNASGVPQLILTAHLLDGAGERLQLDRRFCAGCAAGERLRALTAELVEVLVTAESRRRAPQTFLEVQTTPPGATLYLDGLPVGPVGKRYQVAPGSVELEVRLDGYEPVGRRVKVAANETEVVRFDLVPRGGRDPVRPLWGWLTLSGGAALTATGIALWAADGPRFERGDRQPERYETATFGAITTLFGAAAVVTGGVLLWHAYGIGHEEVAVGAAVTGDGAGVSIGGVF